MGNKIRVLHVGLSENVGGIETVVRSWHKCLPEDICFDFVNNNVGSLAFEKEFVETGSHIYKIPSRKTDFMGSKNALKNIVREGKYDYLHFHAMSLSWPEPVLIGAKFPHTQAIIHSHTVLDNNISLKYKLLHKIGNYRLRHIQYLKLACGENAGISMFGNKEFKVIPNGIEIDRFAFNKEKRNRTRSKFGISDDTFVIGHVGRPGPTKNYPMIFEVFSNLLADKNDCVLLLVGNIENDYEIQSLLKKYNCKDHVIFAGFVKDCSDLYCAMDCFFFPSLYEGFSVSLIEAQAAGLPCVVGNVATETKMSENFVFVDTKSPEHAKREIDRIMLNINKREQLQVNKKYDIKVTSEMMFSYYRSNL